MQKSPCPYAFVFDFDGTTALTFEPSPNGIGVKEAYRLACEQVFGSSDGGRLYDAVGGIGNRAPAEFVCAVLEINSIGELAGRAKRYLKEHLGSLSGLVPQGKGAKLVWRDEYASVVITELIVRVKLKILREQIGTKFPDGSTWPRPAPGFVQMMRAVERFNLADTKVVVIPGIVSSGHEIFIAECFKNWRLSVPQLILSDDTLRSEAFHSVPNVEKCKPHRRLLELFCTEWVKAAGIAMKEDPVAALEGRGFYAGDSMEYDGGLARNADLPFLWFNPDQQTKSSYPGRLIRITDWETFAQRILSEEAVLLMREGRSMVEILGRLSF